MNLQAEIPLHYKSMVCVITDHQEGLDFGLWGHRPRGGCVNDEFND
jgi:hypothetical protein